MSRRFALVVLVLGTVGVGALALGNDPASGERSQGGQTVVSFTGSITPQLLPRVGQAPVSVRVEGDVEAVTGHDLQQLRTIQVALNAQGGLSDRGLPKCALRSIQPASSRAAMAACGDALVGHGAVTVQATFPEQDAFQVQTHLLAFNAKLADGRKGIFAQLYTRDPPGSLTLLFRIKHVPGTFGTQFTAVLPERAWGWAYITHFEMTLERTYRYKGRTMSYLSAGCPAPSGFPGTVFPFARARYSFGNGRELSTTLVRHCTVRKEGSSR